MRAEWSSSGTFTADANASVALTIIHLLATTAKQPLLSICAQWGLARRLKGRAEYGWTWPLDEINARHYVAWPQQNMHENHPWITLPRYRNRNFIIHFSFSLSYIFFASISFAYFYFYFHGIHNLIVIVVANEYSSRWTWDNRANFE